MQIPKEATNHFKRQCEYKRLEVICSLLKEGDNVLDVGCGIGTYTSNPLSYLPINITAIDIDPKTIEYANSRNQHSNLNFMVALGESFESNIKYDVIVCSHILEHISDPMMLLINMNRLLKDSGLLYVAIPNGYGWFEVQNFIPRMLWKVSWGRKLVWKMMGKKAKDTLNMDDWHIHYFTIGCIKHLLKQSGWHIMLHFNDEFLGGVIFDRILPKFSIIDKWNAQMADRIPARLANSWIFICQNNLR